MRGSGFVVFGDLGGSTSALRGLDGEGVFGKGMVSSFSSCCRLLVGGGKGKGGGGRKGRRKGRKRANALSCPRESPTPTPNRTQPSPSSQVLQQSMLSKRDF